jgi:hypothetical protein
VVRIGDVWDSTTDVLAGRSGVLVPIAALAFALPPVVQAGVRLYGGASPGMALLASLIGLVGLVATLWGSLAVAAVASDPATTRADAGRLAGARLGKGLVVVLVLIAAAILLTLPIVFALALTGFDFRAAAAAQAAGQMPAIAPGARPFVSLYGLALVALGLWAGARLFLLYVVVLIEKRGIGALGRSVQLTRGMTAKLVGVVVVLTIGYLVASMAAQSVVGLAARLALGPENAATALFLATIAGAVLTAAFTTIIQVFAARLYAAIVARPPA